MPNVPARQEPSRFGLFLQPEESAPPPHASRSLVQMARIALRSVWLVTTFAVVVAGIAAVVVYRMPRVYRASTSLRIDDKIQNLPEVFRDVTSGTELVTEMEVLKSRSLAEDAVTSLALQVRLVEPRVLVRAQYLTDVTVRRDAPSAQYVFTRTANGSYSVQDTNSAEITTVSIGQRSQFRGIGFVLSPKVAQLSELRLVVLPFDRTVEDFASNLTVSQSNREARIVVVQYDDRDRDLVWQVPNFMVSRFMARRLEARRSEAAASVVFLRSQVDTISNQLALAEGSLRTFRERDQVVNPQVESSSQVTRLVSLQAQRGEIEAERSALARVVAGIDSEAVALGPAAPSPYRRMLAFPTLLRNPAASELLRSLASVEDQRSTLLTRRTPTDPDVQVLTDRVKELENQLRGIGTTYLQGLTDQVVGIDSVLRSFGSQLAKVPSRELEYARLERQPKVLEDMYALLQTRLKEAEIAAAASDPSIRIVDPAVSPIRPIKPRRVLIVIGAFLAALMLGVGGVIAREYLDKSVHTRADVHGATGLPVVGLIPTIPRQGNVAALIAKNGRPVRRTSPQLPRSAHGTPAPAEPPAPAAPAKSEFVLLRSPEMNLPPSSAAPPPRSAVPLPAEAVKREPVRHVTIEGIGTAVAEAYGSLQTNISYTSSNEVLKLLLFTSSMPGEGKTTTAANLALTFSQRGLRVLLVDADLRRGAIHTLFEGPRGPGMTDVLRGAKKLSDVVRVVQVDEGEAMHYITTGQLPSYPTQVLESKAMQEFLREARDGYDFVILDSPPVNLITDAAILGAQADAVLLVARAGQTATHALSYAMAQLQRVRAQVVGVVLNDIDFERDSIYDATYRYYAYEQYTSDSTR